MNFCFNLFLFVKIVIVFQALEKLVTEIYIG